MVSRDTCRNRIMRAFHLLEKDENTDEVSVLNQSETQITLA